MSDQIVCPHCGYTFKDSQIYVNLVEAGTEGIIACVECEEDFYFTPKWHVEFQCRKIEE